MSDPTPQQRADFIVRKLEQFIREGKTERGMSFKTWQSMARAELANAFADIDQRNIRTRSDLTVRRLIFLGASCLVTIGFWGAVLSIDKNYGLLAAALILVAGIVLLWAASEAGIRGLLARRAAAKREQRFGRIEDFDRQLEKLEGEIWRKLEQTRKKAEAGKGE